MIAIFKPVNNWYWYDIREFEIINWKPSTYKWLKVSDYLWVMYELPIYKPKVYYKTKKEYLAQFT